MQRSGYSNKRTDHVRDCAHKNNFVETTSLLGALHTHAYACVCSEHIYIYDTILDDDALIL